MSIRAFVEEHYRHFNAGTLQRAASSLVHHIEHGGKVFVTLAGAMSTAEIGRSLAQMIRSGHVAAISCTGANLEEDIFHLVARHAYVAIPSPDDLTAQDEVALLEQHLNRVTDVCIPEEEAIRNIERALMEVWTQAHENGEALLPHEYLYRLLRSGVLASAYEGQPEHSWLLAAAECDLPLYVPGWEDSTLGNIFAARCSQGALSPDIVLSGTHYMTHLMTFYRASVQPLAFLQSGGGIAGDFPICVVPLLHQDLGEHDVPLWAWFCQITDASASYGGYSGAPPNEKISWGKLSAQTPRFNIQSDASIVLPLLFGYVLDL